MADINCERFGNAVGRHHAKFARAEFCVRGSAELDDQPLGFKDLALAFHVYGYPPDQLRETAQERDHTRTRQPGGPPLIMDEFGASNDSPATAQTVSSISTRRMSAWRTSPFGTAAPRTGLVAVSAPSRSTTSSTWT